MSFIPVCIRYTSISIALSDMILYTRHTVLYSAKGQTAQQVQLRLAKARQGKRVRVAGRNCSANTALAGYTRTKWGKRKVGCRLMVLLLLVAEVALVQYGFAYFRFRWMGSQ